MKSYIVLYRDSTEEVQPFRCQAEDQDHAEEQTINAFPDCEIVLVHQVDRNNQSWLKTNTYKTVNVNDIIGDYHKEKVWEAIANSEISFGSNHDTLIHPNTLLDIVEDAVYAETTGQNDTQLQEIKKRIHYMQENNILVSLGS